MNCPYCRAHNHTGDHRCSRCGRRLDESSARPAMFPIQQSAAAPALYHFAVPEPPPEAQRPQLVRDLPRPAMDDATDGGAAIQPSLFGPMELAPRRESAARTDVPAPPRRKFDRTLQRKLEFERRIDSGQTSPQASQSAVYCQARVADAGQRCAAALIDTVLPGALLAVFIAASYVVSGQIDLRPAALGVYAFAALAAIVLYRLVFCLGEVDTLGLKWTGLRLLDFDGHRPERRARLFRIAGGFVSLLSAGMGLAWALFDEERLTWHDHMTETFPSPRY